MPTPDPTPETAPAPATPSFREALRFWLRLGLISFGGPSGQIAIMHTELVEKRKWISEERFLHALNYCMLLPGPEAQQLATYIGWLLHRTRGGLAAGILFVLPAAVLLLFLSWIYVVFGHVSWIAAFFHGLKPAVIAIVSVAVLRIGQRTLKTPALWTIAALSFLGIALFSVPFPAIVLGAGVIGWVGSKLLPRQFHTGSGHAPTLDQTPTGRAVIKTQNLFNTLRTVAIGLVLWLTPVFLAGAILGWNHAIAKEGVFFSKAALVTFGGAYAVLPYVAQHAVEQFHWLTPPQMLDGLALAETTPGPLIMVLQFVGFVGAWQNPETLPPLLAAVLGAALTTWVTFAPSFLFIFAGAPYIEKMRGVAWLTAALSAITAAVVGVILNLAVWFAGHTIFTDIRATEFHSADPTVTSTAISGSIHIDFFSLILSIAGIVALRKYKLDVVYLVPLYGIIGVIYSYFL